MEDPFSNPENTWNAYVAPQNNRFANPSLHKDGVWQNLFKLADDGIVQPFIFGAGVKSGQGFQVLFYRWNERSEFYVVSSGCQQGFGDIYYAAGVDTSSVPVNEIVANNSASMRVLTPEEAKEFFPALSNSPFFPLAMLELGPALQSVPIQPIPGNVQPFTFLQNTPVI